MCAQLTAAAANEPVRSFAAPSLQPAAAGAALAASSANSNEDVQVAQVPPAAAAATPASSASKPTPQWPLTAEDLANKRKAATAPAAPEPKWTEAEMLIAKAQCTNLLKDVEAVYVELESVREGECGTAAPVQLMAIGKNPQVVISPPAVVTCDMVAALHTWLKKDMQPLARRVFNSPIVKIENMSSYSCRNAYGRTKTRLSEHGKANALDIRGFVTASGHGSEVLADWGPTQRDIRAAEVAAAKAAAIKAAALKAEAERNAVTPATNPASPGANPVTPVAEAAEPLLNVGTLVEGLPRLQPTERPTGLTLAPRSQLGGPRPAEAEKTKVGVAKTQPSTPSKNDLNSKQRFLREAHVSDCRIFGTVLGPEANNAHRNHFHLDMAERSSSFCE